MSKRGYTFVNTKLPENALNFSRHSRYVRETILERVYPHKVIIPMKQHFGVDAVPVVERGDTVTIGQCIGMPAPNTFSVPVHASISGIVKEVKKITLPNGVVTSAVVIESDNKRTFHQSIRPRTNIDIDAKTVTGIVKNAGIVGMGGEGIPTVAKINRARKYKVKDLLVNCLQSEPYATCDLYRVSEYADYVVMGAVALAGATGAKNIRFCISRERSYEIGALTEAISRVKEEYYGMKFEILQFKERFPQGYYRLIARAVYGVEVDMNEILEDKVGAVLFNCSTCNAVWEAVADNMPMVNRIITVTGDTSEGHNVMVPIGTPISDLLGKVDMIYTANKIVWGNALTGLSTGDMETPIIKTTSAVTVIKRLESPKTPCMHCGMCYDACPMDIVPSITARLIENGENETAIAENALKCISCGTCSYICPAGIDLTKTISTFAMANRHKEDTPVTVDHFKTVSKINIGDVSLLETFEYADEENDGASNEGDELILPFEGGKRV